MLRQYRIVIKGLGSGVLAAETRNQAYGKAYKKVKGIGHYDNFINFKKDVESLKLIGE